MPGLPGSGVIDLMLVAAPGGVDRAADRLVRLGFQRRDDRDARLAGRPGLVGMVAWRGRPYAVRLDVLPDADSGIRPALASPRPAARRPAAPARLRRPEAAPRVGRRRRPGDVRGGHVVVDRGHAGATGPGTGRLPVAGAAGQPARPPSSRAARQPARSGPVRVDPASRPRLRGGARAGSPRRSRASPILPPATIGIIGGGQLGRMIALAARAMGYRIAVLDPDPACPSARGRGPPRRGPLRRPARGRRARGADAPSSRTSSSTSTPRSWRRSSPRASRSGPACSLSASPRTGSPSVGGWRRRARGSRDGARSGARAEVRVALREIGLPARLKAPLGGYDGRSQVRIAREADVAEAWEALAGPPSSRDPRLPRSARPAMLLEQELAFDRRAERRRRPRPGRRRPRVPGGAQRPRRGDPRGVRRARAGRTPGGRARARPRRAARDRAGRRGDAHRRDVPPRATGRSS